MDMVDSMAEGMTREMAVGEVDGIDEGTAEGMAVGSLL